MKANETFFYYYNLYLEMEREMNFLTDHNRELNRANNFIEKKKERSLLHVCGAHFR